jgi:uncharacterized protein YbjT (DUF2867 family)
MKRILLTGGTGVLGRELVPRLKAAGYRVRIMSRRAPHPGEDEGLEWAQASLEKGTGLAEAMDGANAVIHAASNSTKRQVDVDGTQRLLDHAQAAGVDQFVYISIVGIDQIDFSYYKNKLDAERLIAASPVPWTILRATQFHEFIDRLLRPLTRLPLVLVPKDWQFQTISAGEVADQLVAALGQGPSGRLPDIGGPEVLPLDEMVRSWLSAQSMRRWLIQLPIPGGLSAGFRQALNTAPGNRVGQITWSQWLDERYTRTTEAKSITVTGSAK